MTKIQFIKWVGGGIVVGGIAGSIPLIIHFAMKKDWQDNWIPKSMLDIKKGVLLGLKDNTDTISHKCNTLMIPKSVHEIAGSAFNQTQTDKSNAAFSPNTGWIKYLHEQNGIGGYIIQDLAFHNTSFAALTIHKCSTIGRLAFASDSEGYSGFTSAGLDRCTSIGESAFRNNSELDAIVAPKCTSLGDTVFDGCSFLERCYIPKVSAIGANAFRDCHKLNFLTIGSADVNTPITYNSFFSANVPFLIEDNNTTNEPEWYIHVPSGMASLYVASWSIPQLTQWISEIVN